MLTSVWIKDFKSYGGATLKLAPLTVLIGANASGKSNAIEALRLLSWIAQGNRLSTIKYAVYGGDGAVRGTTETLARRGLDEFEMSVRLDRQGWNKYKIAIKRTPDDELHIVGESITSAGTTVPLYEIVPSQSSMGNDLRVAYNNFARGGKKPQVTCTDQMAVLLQMQSAARFESGHQHAQNNIPNICKSFQTQIGGTIFLDPQPALMRSYSFKSETRLSGDGSNLSGVLYNITRDKDGNEKVLQLIRSLPEQDISAIDFIETPRGEVMVVVEETFGSECKTFDASLLSDGTLRVLSIAAAIYTAPEGSMVVIEEIDNGVHPSRAEMLLRKVSSIAKERSLTVLISSHNPALLDALPDDAIPNVVFCFRNVKSGNSDLIRLEDVIDYPELIAQGSIGHLMTNGLIERFVKHHPGPEEKKQKSLNWLENFKSISEA